MKSAARGHKTSHLGALRSSETGRPEGAHLKSVGRRGMHERKPPKDCLPKRSSSGAILARFCLVGRATKTVKFEHSSFVAQEGGLKEGSHGLRCGSALWVDTSPFTLTNQTPLTPLLQSNDSVSLHTFQWVELSPPKCSIW
jgi:hypothetical protein